MQHVLPISTISFYLSQITLIVQHRYRMEITHHFYCCETCLTDSLAGLHTVSVQWPKCQAITITLKHLPTVQYMKQFPVHAPTVQQPFVRVFTRYSNQFKAHWFWSHVYLPSCFNCCHGRMMVARTMQMNDEITTYDIFNLPLKTHYPTTPIMASHTPLAQKHAKTSPKSTVRRK